MRRDLTAAIKARDRVAVAALRSALAAIDNAEATPVDGAVPPAAAGEHVAGALVGHGAGEAPRRELTDGEVRTIVEAEVRERVSAADGYQRAGRDDLAGRARAEAEALVRYLRRPGPAGRGR